MNILLLCDEYPPGRHGGIGTVAHMLAHSYARMGHKVVVAGFYHRGYGQEDQFEDDGIKVFRFRQKFASPFFKIQDSVIVRAATRFFDVSGLFEWDIRTSLQEYGKFVNKLIADYDIDIIEMADYHDYMRFCKKPVYFPELNAPTVVKLHGSMTYFNSEAGVETPGQIQQMERAILNQADAVVSVSRYTAEKTAKYLQYDEPIGVLYNGIHLPELKHVPEKIKGTVVFTGSLVEKKGIYQLMKAWNKVVAVVPGAQLYVYGKGHVNKLEALLADEAKDSVHFQGHVHRDVLFRKLAEAQVAAFPSYAECFALAPMEAMAVGTAVMYTTRSSGPELIEDGVTGKLADPDDVDGISSILITLLTDEKLCSKLAENGKAFIFDKFNIEAIAKEHIQYYSKVINKSNR